MKHKKEFAISTINITLIIFGLILFITNFQSLSDENRFTDIGVIGVILFICFVAYGNFIYMFTRYGYYKRLLMHQPADSHTIAQFLSHKQPALLILIPSYKEEIPIIRQSLLSAALQDYSNRRVVLLIDNPPNCPQLEETKNLVNELNEEFSNLYKKYKDIDIHSLDIIYDEIIKWFELKRKTYVIRDHTDETLVELTFTKRIERLKQHKASLKKSNLTHESALISNIFNVEISSFERKQFVNFSHASNKSMNLNSYLTVLGKHVKSLKKENGMHLVECSKLESELYFIDAEYVSVLDADSVLTFDYASRLIYEMEKAEFQKTAVIQTPYSAFPKTPIAMERIAGATTDIGYLFHQGYTYFGATFWVGANALIRKKALNDVVEERMEGEKRIKIFIQDRTVIEDTESSVDLASKGWNLYNYPERLSYSATPADFGSLLIQRKRWANGGLIIFPKVIKYLFQRPFQWKKILECFFRAYYLLSIPVAILSFALMQISATPIDINSAFLITVPCLFVYCRDLKLIGYRSTDLFRIMALNMILLPVNAAGVMQSLKQVLFGKQTPFFRTPKISESTPFPIIYPITTSVMFIYFVYSSINNKSLSDAFLACLILYGSLLCFIKKKSIRLN